MPKPLPPVHALQNRFVSPDELAAFKHEFAPSISLCTRLSKEQRIDFSQNFALAAYLHANRQPVHMVLAALGHDLRGEGGQFKEAFIESLGPRRGKRKPQTGELQARVDNLMMAFNQQLHTRSTDVNWRMLSRAHVEPESEEAVVMRGAHMLFSPYDEWRDPEFALMARRWYIPALYHLQHHRLFRDLEGRAFEVEHPKTFGTLSAFSEEHAQKVRSKLAPFIDSLKQRLSEQGLVEGRDYDFQERPKRAVSIDAKMREKSLELEHVPDLYGFRIILHHPERSEPTARERSALVQRCYTVANVVKTLIAINQDVYIKDWDNVDDYIANPKPALSTAVELARGSELPKGCQVINIPFIHAGVHVPIPGKGKHALGHIELQILTREMHDNNEFGGGARTEYKFKEPDPATRAFFTVLAHHRLSASEDKVTSEYESAVRAAKKIEARRENSSRHPRKTLGGD